MYQMLLNYRHGSYYPIGTQSALADVSKEAIAEGLEKGYFKLVSPPEPTAKGTK